MDREIRHLNHSPSWASRNVRVIITGVVGALGILLAVTGGVLLFAERRTKVDVPDPSASTAAPISIQGKVGAQPTPNWKLITRNLPSRSSLKQIQMLNATDGWIAAYPAELFRTSNAAHTWERVKLEVPARGYVTDIFFMSSDAGWVAVSKTELDFDASKGKGSYDDATWMMQTSDGGKTWKERLALEGAQISQICFLDNGEGWAIGRKFGKQAPTRDTNLVLHTNDGGRNWIDLSGKLPASGAGVDHLYGIGVGRALLLTLNGFIYSTTDGGQSWHQDDVFRDQHEQTAIHRVGVTKNERLWLLGGTSSQEGTWSILAIKDKGGIWARHEIGGIDLADAVFLSEDRVLACGSISSDKTLSTREAVVVYSTDRGKNWVIAYRDKQSPGLNALAAIDYKHILAVGEGGLVLQIDIP